MTLEEYIKKQINSGLSINDILDEVRSISEDIEDNAIKHQEFTDVFQDLIDLMKEYYPDFEPILNEAEKEQQKETGRSLAGELAGEIIDSLESLKKFQDTPADDFTQYFSFLNKIKF